MLAGIGSSTAAVLAGWRLIVTWRLWNTVFLTLSVCSSFNIRSTADICCNIDQDSIAIRKPMKRSRAMKLRKPQELRWGLALNRLLRKHTSSTNCLLLTWTKLDSTFLQNEIGDIRVLSRSIKPKRHIISRSLWSCKRLLSHTSYVRARRVVTFPH